MLGQQEQRTRAAVQCRRIARAGERAGARDAGGTVRVIGPSEPPLCQGRSLSLVDWVNPVDCPLNPVDWPYPVNRPYPQLTGITQLTAPSTESTGSNQSTDFTPS